jgi:hypothetical protein
MKQSKLNANCNINLEINNQKYDFGKLAKFIIAYCPVKKTNVYNFKCITTGKSFTDLDKLSKHLTNVILKTNKIKLS